MTTVTGTSVKGRQLLAPGLTAATTLRLSIAPTSGLKYRYYGFCEHVEVDSSIEYANPTWGAPIWYQGVLLSVPAIGAPSSRRIYCYWASAGIPWTLTF